MEDKKPDHSAPDANAPVAITPLIPMANLNYLATRLGTLESLLLELVLQGNSAKECPVPASMVH
jgi:hypothetical protein